jgi:FtsZ-binding cell division protein ZapB
VWSKNVKITRQALEAMQTEIVLLRSTNKQLKHYVTVARANNETFRKQVHQLEKDVQWMKNYLRKRDPKDVTLQLKFPTSWSEDP